VTNHPTGHNGPTTAFAQTVASMADATRRHAEGFRAQERATILARMNEPPTPARPTNQQPPPG
jgi:hypothetical protein